MKICRISRPPVNPIFNKYSNGRDHLLKRMKLMGHEVQDFVIKPFRVPHPYLAYALGIFFSPTRFRKIKPDLLLTDDIESAVASLLLRWIFNIPLVFNFVDDYSLIASYSKNILKNLRVSVLKCLEKTVPKLADMVIAVNLEIIRFCSNAGVPKWKLSLVPNGVDTGLFKPKIGDEMLRDHLNLRDNSVVFFRGKMNRQRRIDIILKAVPIVLTKFPKTKFLLVGDGDNLDNLKALSECLEIEKSVVFVEFQPQDELLKYINLSDICLCPLPSGAALSLLEYAACAKPVILPRGGTEKMGTSHEIIRQNCTLLVKDSPEGFAQGINFLLSNKEIAKEMGRRARELVVRSYDWNILARGYEDALVQIYTRAQLKKI
jgi:glycosyltransferase involved in cell wall biosynthesis